MTVTVHYTDSTLLVASWQNVFFGYWYGGATAEALRVLEGHERAHVLPPASGPVRLRAQRLGRRAGASPPPDASVPATLCASAPSSFYAEDRWRKGEAR